MKSIRYSALLWIFLLGLLIRIAWVIIDPAQPVSDFAWYDKVARNLATGIGYALSEGKPTAYRPPAYPLFLAGIYRLINDSLLAGRLGNALLGAAAVLLTYELARRNFSHREAVWGAALVAFTPSLILYSGLHASENLAIAAILATMLCVQIGVDQNHRGWLIVSGLLLGVASLTRGSLLLLPFAWLVWLIFRGATFRRQLTIMVWLAVGLVIPLLPWITRNAVTFGYFIPLSTNDGINLLISFNPLSEGHFIPGDQIPGLSNLREQNLDEYSYSQATRNMAIEFIRNEPLRSLELAPLKVFHLYRDDVSGVRWSNSNPNKPIPARVILLLIMLAQGYYVLLMLLAFAALYSYRKLPRNGGWIFILTPILYLTLVHMVFFGGDRFHLPLLPFFAIFSGFQAKKLWDRFAIKKRFAQSP
jgi:4-amino-4-deoxy-L-arabinose transferase-like glycosyltransferase